LRVDGGPTRDDFLMQFQADMLGVPVVRNRAEEISAAGSCYMAGLATGFWKELAQIKDMRREDRRYESQFGSDRRARLYAGWKAAVSSVASLAPR
jgi:glycerol kinase